MQSPTETGLKLRLLVLAVTNLCALFVVVTIARAGSESSRWQDIDRRIGGLLDPHGLLLVHPGIDRLYADTLNHEAVIPADRWRADFKRFNQVAGLSARVPFPSHLKRTISRHFGEPEEHVLMPGVQLIVWNLERPIDERRDLMPLIPSARAYIDRNDARIDCPPDDGRLVCPDADWTWVGPTQMTIANEPLSCVWSHPVDGTLTIEFNQLGDWDGVDGWWALSDYAADHADRQAATLTLVAGEEERAFRLVRTRGRRALSMEFPEDFDGQLKLELESAAPGARHLCWSLHLVRFAEPEMEAGGEELDDDGNHDRAAAPPGDHDDGDHHDGDHDGDHDDEEHNDEEHGSERDAESPANTDRGTMRHPGAAPARHGRRDASRRLLDAGSRRNREVSE